MSPIVLDAAATERALEPGPLLAAVRAALIAISEGTASAPPRIAARAPGGLLGAMPGYVPGLGLAAKLVTVFAVPGSPGRSTHRGVVVLFDEQDGRPLVVMDARAVTAARTAASALLGMEALADPHPDRIAVVGTGEQARAQVDLLAALRPEVPVVVGGRDGRAARELADRHPGATAAAIEPAVRDATVVFCCTGAREPVIARDWLRDRTHISSVGGSDGPELDAATVAGADLYVEWDGAAGCPPPAGAHELQGVPPQRVRLLGEVLAARRDGELVPARRAVLTVFKSTGHAALDVAAASVVHRNSRTRKGTTI